MRVFTLLGKELRVILRSRLLLLVLILYPLVIVAILGLAFSQPNQRVPVAIVNEDIIDTNGQLCNPRPCQKPVQGPVPESGRRVLVSSTDVVRALENFTEMTHTDPEEGLRLLRTGQVQAVIYFPPNFARDIADLQTNGIVNITIDQSDPVRAQFMEVLVRGIVQEFQERIVREKVRLVVEAISDVLCQNTNVREPFYDAFCPSLRPGNTLYPGLPGLKDLLEDLRRTQDANLTDEQRLLLDDSILFLENIIETLQNSHGIINSVAEPVRVDVQQERSGHLFIRDLVVPAAIALGIFWTGSVATSSLVVYDRESAAYSRLRITPANAWSIYGSKVLLTLGIVLAQSIVILLAGIVAWDTRVDNPLLTFVVILLSSFAAIGLGLFLAGLSRDVNGTVLLSVLITFPMMLLGGLFFPVSFMPPLAQLLASLLPLTHAVSALRGAMLRGFGMADAQELLGILFAFGLALSLSGILLGRRLERQR